MRPLHNKSLTQIIGKIISVSHLPFQGMLLRKLWQNSTGFIWIPQIFWTSFRLVSDLASVQTHTQAHWSDKDQMDIFR